MRPFNPNIVRTEVGRTGILRPTKFLISTAMPNILASSPFTQLLNSGGFISIWAESASLPGAMLDMAPVRRYGYGPTENKPWGAHFNDIQVVFRADALGIVHGFLHSWMQSAVNYNYNDTMSNSTSIGTSTLVSGASSQSWEVNYKEDYVTTTTISLFDDQGGLNQTMQQQGVPTDGLQKLGDLTPAIQIFLRDCFPVAVGDVPLSWGARGEYIKFPVQFNYFSWSSARQWFGPVAV